MNTIKSVVEVSDDDVGAIRKYYRTNGDSVKTGIQVLKEWIRKQPHLPQDQDDDFLERCLLRNKFRTEIAKRKIDGYFSRLTIYEEIFRPTNGDVVPSKESVSILPCPKLTPAGERVFCLKFANTDPDVYDLDRIFRLLSLYSEILMRYDYSVGEVIVIDCYGFTVEHLKKLTIPSLSKALNLYQVGAYSGRFCGIHYINTPAFFYLVLGLLKIVLPSKFYEKIKSHDELQSLHNFVPKYCLPKEIGGDLPAFAALMEKWDDVFANNTLFFDRNYYNVANESMRIEEVTTGRDDGFGVDGTFKKLNID